MTLFQNLIKTNGDDVVSESILINDDDVVPEWILINDDDVVLESIKQTAMMLFEKCNEEMVISLFQNRKKRQ